MDFYFQNCRSKYLQKLSVKLSYFKINEKWIEILNLFQTSQWLRICELHFDQNCFIRDLEAELTGRPLRKRLKPDAIPTLFLKREENFVHDLNNESFEDIQNSTVLKVISQSL